MWFNILLHVTTQVNNWSSDAQNTWDYPALHVKQLWVRYTPSLQYPAWINVEQWNFDGSVNATGASSNQERGSSAHPPSTIEGKETDVNKDNRSYKSRWVTLTWSVKSKCWCRVLQHLRVNKTNKKILKSQIKLYCVLKKRKLRKICVKFEINFNFTRTTFDIAWYKDRVFDLISEFHTGQGGLFLWIF